jgi:predicted DNA-binding protein (UPF0278 family)
MRTLIITTLLILAFESSFAQADSTLYRSFKKYKELEAKQSKMDSVFISTLKRILNKESNGRELAEDYINFARAGILRWQVALENPDVLFADMTVFEIVELIKAKEAQDADVEKMVEDLRERLREKIREHIRILEDNIRELAQ